MNLSRGMYSPGIARLIGPPGGETQAITPTTRRTGEATCMDHLLGELRGEPLRHPGGQVGDRGSCGLGGGNSPRFKERAEVPAAGSAEAHEPLVSLLGVVFGPLAWRQSAVL